MFIIGDSVTLFNFVHSLNASCPNEVSESGKVSFVRERQYPKAFLPIDFKEEENVILLNLLQPKKAESLIIIAEGIEIFSNDSHPLKVSSSISVTDKTDTFAKIKI